MLKKGLRPTTNEVRVAFEKGRAYHTSLFSLIVVGGPNRGKIGVVAPKNQFKTAVSRNKVRRRVYAVLEKYNGAISSGKVAVLVVKKKEVSDMKIDLLKSAISEILKKTPVMTNK